MTGCSLSPRHAAFLLLQEKWTLFIVDDLAQGPKGFNALLRSGHCLSPATLSSRLSAMVAAGLLTGGGPDRTPYSLTPKARALLPVLDAIEAWAVDQAVRTDAASTT
ncbi:MAG: winged helix-turn-helix transcriptional regulator [Shimia sp.]